ncbi:MAG: DUF1858 domain-containing protein [Bacteroidota bacterium]
MHNAETIQPDVLLPDLFRRYPAVRAVFDRWGLHGCGGPEGPQETLEFFIRIHGVPKEAFLTELREAIESSGQTQPASPPIYFESLADVIYKRFFKAGIIVALTAGCMMGAAVLAVIATTKSFSSVALFPWIQAHANAQVFGWVGLFVMGFAYQAFPRFKLTTLWNPSLANLSLWLIVAGIALRLVAEPLARQSFFFYLGFVSPALELAAVAIFIRVILKTLAQSTQPPQFYDRFIYASLAWLMLAALIEPVIYYLSNTAPNTQVLLRRIATFWGPYRDVQLFGFAVLMIFGVSQRFIPAVYGFREPSVRASTTGFWLFNGTLATGIVSYIAFYTTRLPIFRIGMAFSAVALLSSFILFTVNVRILEHTGEHDRNLKFLRAAYVWAIIAALMLVLFPVYNIATNQKFSHAFFGAYRHALTVGFISMMILGVSSKIVPTLSGANLHRLNSLMLPFVLLNIGNVLRVSSQILTEHLDSWIWVALGTSGFIEVTALALWGIDLWKTMGKRNSNISNAAPPLEQSSVRSQQIAATMTVGRILDLFPEAKEVLLKHGFKDITNPFKRRTIAYAVSLETACRLHGISLSALLAALNEKVKTSHQTPD